MKKIALVTLFMAAVGLVFAVAVYREHRKTQLTSELKTTCESKPADFFASRRSLGLILKERALLSVRLANEQNFSPPGGHIEKDEQPKQALKRELQEELGLTTNTRDFKIYKTFCEVKDDSTAHRTHLFFVKSWQGTMEPPEGTRVKWVTQEYILNSASDSELTDTLEYLKDDNLIN